MKGNVNLKNEKIENIEKTLENTEDEPPDIRGSLHHRKIVLDIETTDLHPAAGQLICVGVKEVDTGITRVFFDRNEEVMVRRFINYFNKGNFGEVIGFNIMHDVRFLFGKCLRFNIRMGSFYRANYNDLMATLKAVKDLYCTNRPGSLNTWVKFIFNESKMQKNASVPQLFNEGKISTIIQYNRKDVELTCKLWKRVRDVLGVKDTRQKVDYSRYTRPNDREDKHLARNISFSDEASNRHRDFHPQSGIGAYDE